MNLKDKRSRHRLTSFLFRSRHQSFDGATLPPRAMIEIKQRILKKLLNRVDEEFRIDEDDCFCS